MTEAEIQRRDWLAARRIPVQAGGFFARLFRSRRQPALPAPASPVAGDVLTGYNLITGRPVVGR